MPRRAPYEQPIREHLASLGFIGKYDPRHIEAFMRLEHPTLDGLGKQQFRREVAIAAACVDEAGRDESEMCAESYGL